jgi:endonuclease YncB( thermonuclease family)
LADPAALPPHSGAALGVRGSGPVRYRVALACGLAALHAVAARAADESGCRGTPAGAAQVTAAIDGRTVQLADGRAVRLAGIEAPEQARTHLESLVLGREVALSGLGSGHDRYGRTVALVALPGEPPGRSVQTALLERGQARVSANTGEYSCAAAFLGAEQKAREGGLGLWADPRYLVRNVEDFAAILAIRGHFAVVEGKVLSVRESGGQIYVNFGRRWSEDFTVTVPKRSERSFTAIGLPLKKLAGQRVRVRGTVEERGGPWIEASRPEQIEIAERGSSGQ